MSIINAINIEDIKNAINADIIDFYDIEKNLYSAICNHKTACGIVKGYQAQAKSYYDCILLLINELWFDLTKEEKELIKQVI